MKSPVRKSPNKHLKSNWKMLDDPLVVNFLNSNRATLNMDYMLKKSRKREHYLGKYTAQDKLEKFILNQ